VKYNSVLFQLSQTWNKTLKQTNTETAVKRFSSCRHPVLFMDSVPKPTAETFQCFMPSIVRRPK